MGTAARLLQIQSARHPRESCVALGSLGCRRDRSSALLRDRDLLQSVVLTAEPSILSFLLFGSAEKEQSRPEQDCTSGGDCCVVARCLIQPAADLADARTDSRRFGRYLAAIKILILHWRRIGGRNVLRCCCAPCCCQDDQNANQCHVFHSTISFLLVVTRNWQFEVRTVLYAARAISWHLPPVSMINRP